MILLSAQIALFSLKSQKLFGVCPLDSHKGLQGVGGRALRSPPIRRCLAVLALNIFLASIDSVSRFSIRLHKIEKYSDFSDDSVANFPGSWQSTPDKLWRQFRGSEFRVLLAQLYILSGFNLKEFLGLIVRLSFKNSMRFATKALDYK